MWHLYAAVFLGVGVGGGVGWVVKVSPYCDACFLFRVHCGIVYYADLGILRLDGDTKRRRAYKWVL